MQEGKGMKRKTLTWAAIALLAVTSLAYAVHTYWTRTATITGIKVIGIEAEILKANDYYAYCNKEAAPLTQAGLFTGVLTIFAENFEDIWLTVNWTCDVPLNITGQYLRYEWAYTGSENAGCITPVSQPFTLSSYQVVNKTLMMWRDPNFQFEVYGYGLQITVTPLTLEYPTPGTYEATVVFTMGFVGA